ncbi:MAG: multifunctional CCA addition/repair protein [Hydrogenophilus sp.]|nr:multifunctional CCA addition/repair protein [Hydrogenophilus sp.]
MPLRSLAALPHLADPLLMDAPPDAAPSFFVHRLRLTPDPLTADLNCYIVGGAVRDALLGLEVHDRDWVVVGATPEQLLARGFRTVGKDFPVFLHPLTQEEYALARTERKVGPGYKGFIPHAHPSVTLEEDLSRRDLTINAIAVARDGTLIDPFGGLLDLRRKRLRHITSAFCEDPLRVLRVARFAARFPDFTLDPTTHHLMQTIARSGELTHLAAERVWQELARGLMEKAPARMIQLLAATDALAVILPEVAALIGVPQPPRHHPEGDVYTHTLHALTLAAERDHPLSVRWAALLHDLGKGTTPAAILPHHYGHEERGARLADLLSRRLKAPADCRELAKLVAREHTLIHQGMRLRPATRLKLLERTDALRRPDRFYQLLDACECDALARPPLRPDYQPIRHRWQQTLAAIRAVPAAPIARALAATPERIPQALRLARLDAIAHLDALSPSSPPPR